MRAKEVIEKLKRNAEVSMQDLFGLINQYPITTLMVRDTANSTIFSMEINKVDMEDGIEFSQKNMGFKAGSFTILTEDIEKVEGWYLDTEDAVTIVCDLKGGFAAQLLILAVSNNEIDMTGYREVEFNEVVDFMADQLEEDAEYTCICTKIADVHGLNLTMSANNAYIETTEEGDTDGQLVVTDGENTMLTLPVFDDSVNEFWMKKQSNTVEVMVSPYGKPFMEIRVLFVKKQK